MCGAIAVPWQASKASALPIGGLVPGRSSCGIARGRAEPIRNPVTGAEHRVGIVLLNGFEFTQNEVGRGWSTSSGAVARKLEDSYAHWCDLHLNQDGVFR